MVFVYSYVNPRKVSCYSKSLRVSTHVKCTPIHIAYTLCGKKRYANSDTTHAKDLSRWVPVGNELAKAMLGGQVGGGGAKE